MAKASAGLCLACGMCCDGSLYLSAGLRAEEVAVMTRLGVPVLQRADGAHLALPCAALDHTRCRIYDERPRRCANYHCRLLVALQVGRVTADKAHATVALAKELRGPQREQFLDYHFRGRARDV